MFCRDCGSANADNATVCVKCSAALQQTAQRVPNHLVGAILVTVFCCQIFGIVSIVYAAQVNTKLLSGDLQGAIASSNKAEAWMWWGFGLGLVPNLVMSVAMLARSLAQ